ncbi:hypothetical protein EON63_10890, partial [archaeon]
MVYSTAFSLLQTLAPCFSEHSTALMEHYQLPSYDLDEDERREMGLDTRSHGRGGGSGEDDENDMEMVSVYI